MTQTHELPIVTQLREPFSHKPTYGFKIENAEAHEATCTEAADLIAEMQLAGFAVWNNLLNGDIEAHTQESSNALQMLHEAIKKAGAA